MSMRSEHDATGLGVITRFELLATCEIALRSRNSFELRLMPQFSYGELLERCRTIAESIAQASPNFSLALAVAADAAGRQQDWHSMNRFLVASQKSGPNEQVIGRYRFRVAEENLTQLTPAAKHSYESDLRLQVVSKKSTPYIARRYASDEAFRERVAAVLSEMDHADIQRFIRTLRSMLPRAPQ
ncbi:hypothetical protein [Devosia sp. RR2S18]|uniref:hypothetical protein n=1 Tax=Devosia rhizosphaerae TaxID=3049774 RepID=UPI0025415C4A|nr:hypothetical protein [Devosia sp. RR2S18]WIJ23917.1 hypothetical protein QOV41_12795 [Devosia sp. RR2S18]